MGESKPLEEIRNWEHPHWYGIDQFKEIVTLTFLENQKGLFHNLTTHFRLPVKLWTTSGPCREASYTAHHVKPRVKVYSPREESFPIPLKYIAVTRTTHTNLDVKQEKRIDDYWNIDGSRDFSDPWTGFTQFTLLDEKAPDGYMWCGGDRRENSLHPGQIIYDQSSGNQWESMSSWRRSRSGLRKSSTLKTQDCVGSISSTPRKRNSKETIKNARKELETSVAPAMPGKIMKNCGSGVSNKIQTTCVCSGSWWFHKNAYGKIRCRIIMKTILQEKVRIHYSTTIWFTNLFLCLKLWKFLQQKQRWTRNVKNWRKFRRGTWQKSKVRERWSMQQERPALQFILHH